MDTKPQTIDAYLERVKDPQARETLEKLRAQLRKLLPGSEELISYAMPAFRVGKDVIAGFGFFGKKCGLYPFSGQVVETLGPKLDGYATSKSGITFAPDEPLPLKIVKAVVDARKKEIAGGDYGAPAGKTKGAIKDRVTDAALEEATGRDWKGWLKTLDKAGGKELNHKQLVAQLAKDVKSGWWQQTIAVGYEQQRGLRVVGEASGMGFQIGVQRTVPLTAEQAWTLLSENPQQWLGAKVQFEPGRAYKVAKRKGAPAVTGEVRVVRPGNRIRMTWQPEGWKKPATLQVTVMPKTKATSVHVHMEKLPDASAREQMRAHWAAVLEKLVMKATG